MEIIFSLFRLGSTNWLFAAFIGAAFGLLIPILGRVFLFGLRLLSRDQIQGKWYNHFFSYDEDDSLFVIEEVEIEKGFNNRFSVRTHLTNNSAATYRGKVKFEKNFLLLELHARNHDENVCCRFPTPPIFSNETILVGASLAQDFSGQATAAVNILARQQLTKETVQELMRGRSSVAARNRTLRVMKRQ